MVSFFKKTYLIDKGAESLKKLSPMFEWLCTLTLHPDFYNWNVVKVRLIWYQMLIKVMIPSPLSRTAIEMHDSLFN